MISPPWFLVTLPGQTVTRCDRQYSVVAACTVGTQDRNTQRLSLYSRAAHTLLLNSTPLQRVHRLTATFALKGTHKEWVTEMIVNVL